MLSLSLDMAHPAVPFQISFRRPYDIKAITQLLLYSLIFLLGTMGNGMVIKHFIRAQDRPGSRFVLSLAAVDFLSSILVPFTVIISVIYFPHSPLGHIGALITAPWTLSTYFASAWMLVAVSLERTR